MVSSKIPNYEKIIADSEGFKINAFPSSVDGKRVWLEKKDLRQETVPEDPDILVKFGLEKSDKILFIAGYYGNWANAIAQAGCQVTYTELSKPIVEFAKKKFGQNKNIIDFQVANFLEIPKDSTKYDWTVSFEPVGITTSLPIAIVRSLMNHKGVKIIHFPRPSLPEDKYNTMAKIAKIYNCLFSRKSVIIQGTTNQKPISANHLIYTFLTNDNSRQKSITDIQALESNQFTAESLERLTKLAKIIKHKYRVSTLS